ncbi:MAG: SufD family Fe-S cluster assembly protein [Alphaproteobacteria bacterium]|nr:SufD family Fe-S cluster assembly protein [Alphaproteobacteria bacterium]
MKPIPKPRIVFENGEWNRTLSSLDGLPANIVRGNEIRLEKNTCLITTPIELYFKGKSEIDLKITLEESCNLTLIEKFESGNAIINAEISLAHQAKLTHGIISSQSVALKTTANIEAGGYYDNFTMLLDGNKTDNDINVTLQGAMAQCNLQGLMLLRGAANTTTTTRVLHSAPNCASRQIYKSVLADKSHATFNGKITVAENAQKTDGYQLSRALLLSDQAEMIASPELEINADDVKCGHGSTIGDLDENALFYLRSRGIGETEAKSLLVSAFINELTDSIQISSLRNAASAEAERWANNARI